VAVDCDRAGVFFEALDGATEDLSDLFAGGTADQPTDYLLNAEGTLHFCEGTWYTHLVVVADVRVVGDAGRDVTTLRGGRLESVVTVSGEQAVTLQGLRIAGGQTPLYGGALFATGGDLVIEGCAFSENYAEYNGGAVALFDADAQLSDVIFEDNSTSQFWGHGYTPGGGGLYVESGVVTIADALFDFNVSAEGGGLHLFDASASLTRVLFDADFAHEGGGMFLRSSQATLDEVTFDGNGVNIANGGGLSLSGSAVEVTRGVFTGNYTFHEGGAVAMTTGSGATFVETVFSENQATGAGGAGVYVGEGGLFVTVSDFAGNLPDDTYVSAGLSYTWGEGASFSCTASGCE
jgi:hypothetical protein